MQLKDFTSLQEAKDYKILTLKTSEERMLNERGIFSLIGIPRGEVFMQAIEANPDIPERVKAWFKPSEQGIDIADPNALGILAGMVAVDVLTQSDNDALRDYAYIETQPFKTATKHDFELAKGTITRKAVTQTDGILTINTNTDCEAHSPQVYQYIESADFYKRVAGFRGVSVASKYQIEVPRVANLFVDDAYGVVV